jgi:hypothetical protein
MPLYCTSSTLCTMSTPSPASGDAARVFHSQQQRRRLICIVGLYGLLCFDQVSTILARHLFTRKSSFTFVPDGIWQATLANDTEQWRSDVYARMNADHAVIRTGIRARVYEDSRTEIRSDFDVISATSIKLSRQIRCVRRKEKK